MLSNNRLSAALSPVKVQPDVTSPGDTAAIAASGARFREAMQAQQRTANADTAAARQIREHDVAQAGNDAQRAAAARQADRIQQQSARDQTWHASDARAQAARAVGSRMAASDAAQNADAVRQASLRAANNADMTAAQQAENQASATQDAKRITKEVTRTADENQDKRLHDHTGTSQTASTGSTGQPSTDAAVQAIAGRSQNDARGDGDANREGAAGDRMDTKAGASAIGTVASKMTAGVPGAAGIEAAANAGANGRGVSAANTTQTATAQATAAASQASVGGSQDTTGAADGLASGATPGSASGATGSADGTTNGASDSALGDGSSPMNASALDGGVNALNNAASTEKDGAIVADTGATRTAGGIGSIATGMQNVAAAGFAAQANGLANGPTSGTNKAQRGQDDNLGAAFNADKKTGLTGDKAAGFAMTGMQADASADQAKSIDGNANAGANGQAPDASLLAGINQSTLHVDNALSASAQTQASQSAGANQSAYSNGNIDMPFADPRWADAFSQRVVMMSRDGNSQASLHLNPPNLGPIQVVLSMVGNQAQASFVSQNANVRDAIAAAMPSLKNRFADSGLSLAQTNVNATMPANAGINADFNASLTAGLSSQNSNTDAGTGSRGQNNSASADQFALPGERRGITAALTPVAAANAWRPAGHSVDSGTGRLGIDTFA